MLAHLAGNMRGYGVTIFEFNPKNSIGQGLSDRAFHLNNIIF